MWREENPTNFYVIVGKLVPIESPTERLTCSFFFSKYLFFSPLLLLSLLLPLCLWHTGGLINFSRR